MLEIIEPPVGKQITVITAHPEDMESWCAGTVIQAIDAGCEARLLLVTSGDKGSGDPATNPGELVLRRGAEADSGSARRRSARRSSAGR
jgi:LmbE family N-acetylglucosaminyl deacetylase